MKLCINTLVFLIITLQSWAVSASEPWALMPYPESVERYQGQFEIPQQLTVNFNQVSQQRQQHIVTTLQSALANLGSTKLQVVTDASQAILVIQSQQQDSALLPPAKMIEQYQLAIAVNQIQLNAHSEIGVMRGVQTLLQLLFQFPNKLPLLTISDQPRFEWRGLLIDSVRHWMPVDTIKRQIDGIAAAKLNVFHWHLTDDQGWRIESKTYPKLHQMASDGLYYSQAQIKAVVQYAAIRGIRVLPEFDVPGHASAIAVAYPELITKPGPYQIERQWGVFEPLLDPSNPEVYQFIDSIVGELAGLFPDPYLHIGGDEVHPTQWQQSKAVQTYMKTHQLADTYQLQAHFNQKVQLILKKHGKFMMGWDEIFHPDLPKDILVQSWRGHDSLGQIAKAGYQGLLSTGFYIDQPQATSYHYRNDPVPAQSLDESTNAIALDDSTQFYQFTITRLKGSAVTGKLAINSDSAVVILNQQKPRAANQFTQQHQLTRFQLDSWMGPLTFELNLQQAADLSSRVLIGNSPYQIEFSSLKAKPELLQSLTPIAQDTQAMQDQVLGGEATIWSEMVTQHNIDLRVWPRTFAIAERLWSPQTRSNQDDMYQRLAIMDKYAASIVGLHQQKQQEAGLKQLIAEGYDIRPLLLLAETIEQAQYYTRHHVKFQNQEYHQLAPLDRFVDYLPAESLALVNFQRDIAALAQGNRDKLMAIKQQLKTWLFNQRALELTLNISPRMDHLATLVDKNNQALQLGLLVANKCFNKQSQQKRNHTRNQLWQLAEIEQEMIVSVALHVEDLMDACWR